MLFNFKAFTTGDPAVKDTIKAFGRAGAVVISSAADAKSTKRAGVEFKTLHLSFADSQQVELLIKATGDIFEVRLNGKQIPIRAQDDIALAAKEIVAKLDANRAKFQKALTAVKMPAPVAARTSRTNMLAQLTAQRDGLKAEIADVQKQLDELEATNA